MPFINTITAGKLARLAGTPACHTRLDARTDEDFAEDLRWSHPVDPCTADVEVVACDGPCRWCGDATGETHGWPPPRGRA